MSSSLLSGFVAVNRRLCEQVDRLLPRSWRVDGNRHFVDVVLPSLIVDRSVIYDLGGGKHPCISMSEKIARGIVLVGVDIDAEELASAPAGTYDRCIVSDVALLSGGADGDLVVCQSLLEHVSNVPQAIRAVSTALVPGGRAALFFPSRNAVFARLNLVLPEGLKKRLLYSLFPDSRKGQGFKSYYSNCTEADVSRLAADSGFSVEAVHRYWMSDYFSFFAPLHIAWRLYQLVARAVFGSSAAETLTVVLRKM